MTTESKRDKIAEYARDAVRRSVFEAVRDAGGQFVDRLISNRHPEWGMTSDLSPADGLVAARAIQNAARGRLVEYLKQAREEGMSWHKIGGTLDMQTRAKILDVTISDCAFDLAAGPRREYSWEDRYFTWSCPACGELIRDYGPDAYPEGGERGGHKPGCKRIAVERRAYSQYCKGA